MDSKVASMALSLVSGMVLGAFGFWLISTSSGHGQINDLPPIAHLAPADKSAGLDARVEDLERVVARLDRKLTGLLQPDQSNGPSVTSDGSAKRNLHPGANEKEIGQQPSVNMAISKAEHAFRNQSSDDSWSTRVVDRIKVIDQAIEQFDVAIENVSCGDSLCKVIANADRELEVEDLILELSMVATPELSKWRTIEVQDQPDSNTKRLTLMGIRRNRTW